MPILLTDTIAPNNTTFKAVLGKDVGGALTGSIVSSSGEIISTDIISSTASISGTGSFGHISSSGGIFGDLKENSAGALKTVIFDNSTKQLFFTTSTAVGVPSLNAVSQVDPFEFASGKVMTASNGAGSGILVNKIFNGIQSNGAGRAEFGFNAFGGGSFVVTGGETAETDSSYNGLWISGGVNNANIAPSITSRGSDLSSADEGDRGLDIIHAKNSDTVYFKVANFNFGKNISETVNYNLILHSGSTSNASTFGNLRINLARTELIDANQILIRPINSNTVDSTVQYNPSIKTRIGQEGGTGADQFMVFSGSGVILPPTSSLPTAIAGGILYSGSQFYIAVP